MESVLPRPSFRLSSVVALLTLTILSVLFITSPISSESSLSQVHRRSIELPPLVLRQEDPPAPTTTTEETTSTSTTSTTSTASTTSTTSSSTTTSTRTSTSTTPTRTVTSTRPTSTGTTTQTITSTTSGSSTGTSTTSSTSPISTSTTSPNAPTASSAGTSDPVSGTTLVVPPDFVPGGASSSTPVNGATRANGGVTPTSTTKADSTGASKKSFWDNKGAVAGVFVLISVVVLALLALLWRALARRRAAARQKRLTAQLFGGKYAESDFAPSNNGHSNSGAAAYGDVESSRGGNDTRFQGAPITVGASASDNPFEPNAQYGATSSNPWSPPPVASTSRVSPETGVSTGYQPPHSAASTYETAQSHYYTPAGSEQSHNHYASNVPAVTVTSPQQYLPPSHISASASSLSAYSNDPSASAPPTAFKGLGGAGDRVSYDSFYGGKAL